MTALKESARPHRTTFHGLPGLLADSLPNRFGNALIDAWLATQGRTSESFNAVERLCYTGSRGMGALEFAPVLGPKPRAATKIQIDSLVRLASEVLMKRGRAGRILDEVREAVARWPVFGAQAKLAEDWIDKISKTHRLHLSKI